MHVPFPRLTMHRSDPAWNRTWDHRLTNSAVSEPNKSALDLYPCPPLHFLFRQMSMQSLIEILRSVVSAVSPSIYNAAVKRSSFLFFFLSRNEFSPAVGFRLRFDSSRQPLFRHRKKSSCNVNNAKTKLKRRGKERTRSVQKYISKDCCNLSSSLSIILYSLVH